MTLGEAALIFESWRETPPTHHMMQALARLWGWKGPPRAICSDEGRDPPMPRHAPTPPNEALAIPGLTHRPVGEGLPAVVLDFEALKRSYRR
jgi:hypothetical protein